MICAWQSFLSILPFWIRNDVDKLGKTNLMELRLRLDMYPTLKTKNEHVYLHRKITAEDLHFCINTASRYSPWLAQTANQGFITAPGGHRIGICGNAGGYAGTLTDITGITSLCLRVARDFPGIAEQLAAVTGSILIIGKPGCGKTTLLRDLIRYRSEKAGECVCVVDEREEIFPRANGKFCFQIGLNTDVLHRCSKPEGIEILLRTMNPDTIAVDEISAEDDCLALLKSGWCGVNLLATAHAENKYELLKRTVYHPLIKHNLFDTLVVINKDMSYHVERLKQ